MKKLLISTGFSILSIIVFGQRNTPSSSGESGGSSSYQQSSGGGSYQQSSRTENYQQSTQQPARTDNYQQSTQQPERAEPAQQSTQQPAKTENSQLQTTTSKPNMPEDKKSNGKNEKWDKHPKDSLKGKGHNTYSSSKSNEEETKNLQLWECPKCGRTFTSPPANGLCPYDGTAVGRIK
ncbi:MAG TPA: hypothetical protein VK783_06815 [Bacteroidia bacterium]|jgi:hypothetical protein|nr:hypothetical protein [Bacteroidia bacterium]